MITSMCLALRSWQAQDEGSKFPDAAKVLSEDFYVDDLVTGAETVNDVLKLKQDIIEF